MHTFCSSILVLLALVPSLALAFESKPNPEVSQEIRNQAALSKLENESSVVTVYVKGLCCASCGIGVRKKLTKLDFVDRSRFVDGIELDTKHQLATIALNDQHELDVAEVAQAVRDAGYDPVHLYTLKNSALDTTQLSEK